MWKLVGWAKPPILGPLGLSCRDKGMPTVSETLHGKVVQGVALRLRPPSVVQFMSLEHVP